MKSTGGISLVLGLWLIIAPFALGAAGVRLVWTANDILIGLLLVALSVWMLAGTRPVGGPWIEMICGIWLLGAPALMVYRSKAGAINDVIVGAIVLGVSFAAARRIGHRRTTV
jgi:SPW repeat-containing protein